MANTVRITATTKDNASGPLDNIRDKFDKIQKQGAKGFGIGVAAGATAFGLNAVASAADAAAAAVVSFITESVAKASEEEAGIARLNTALEENIDSWDGNRDAVEEVIAAREKLAFSDGEQRDSLAKLVTRTHDATAALDLQRQAMDLARLRGMDLATASEILGKVYGGNVGILSRYGIAVTKGATATEALAEIQRAAAGQADAFAETAAGSAQSLQIAIDDLQEDIGKELLPVVKELTQWARDDLVPALTSVVDWVKQNSVAFDELGVAITSMTQGPVAGAQAQMALLQKRQDEAFAQRILDQIDAFKKAHQGETGALKGTTGAVAKFGDVAEDAGKQVSDLAEQTMDFVDAQKSMRDIIRGAAKTLGDQKFGHKELRLELQGNKLDLKDNIDKLHDLEAIKHPTRDTRQDIIDTKLAIIDGKKRSIELKGELDATGKVSLSRTESWVDRLKSSLDEAGQSARDLRVELSKLPGASTGGGRGGRSGVVPGGGNHQPDEDRAGGGSVLPGRSYNVGEFEEEKLHMLPGGGGVVVPGGRGRRGGGGVTINISGVSVLTPGSAEALAREIGPHVTRWQQQRGL